MDENDLKQSKFGIGVKTSLICGINVLVLLAIGSAILLKFESNLTKFIVGEYVLNIEKTIGEQGENEKDSLDRRFRVNASIIAGLSAPFVYNMDDRGLKMAIKPSMDLDEILAIKVVDIDNAPFFAIWKGTEITTGTTVPESVILNENLSSKAYSYARDEKVGYVQVYYTDSLLVEQLRAIKGNARAEISAFRLKIEQSIDKAFIIQIIGVICIILALVATIVVCLRIIVIKPVEKCIRLAKKMAEGDFTQHLEIDRKDEIGVLAGALNHMASSVGGMFRDVSAGVVTLSSSSTKLTAISRQMFSGAEQTSNKSDSVTSAAHGMSSNMKSVATATEQASSNLSMVATASEEIIVTVNEIAQNTEKAREITGDAVLQANNASDQLTQLGKAAQEIGTVTEAITEISEQTNLLALNATIEAARAGEAGKGFAVVANEIKDLARQTFAEIEDIKSKVEDIQGATSTTVAGIGEVLKVIDDVNAIVSTIASAVEEQSITTKDIVSNIYKASQGIEDVNNRVVQSSAASEEIAEDITEVNHAAGEISNSSSQVNNSAEELFRLAEQLNEMIEKLKV